MASIAPKKKTHRQACEVCCGSWKEDYKESSRGGNGTK